MAFEVQLLHTAGETADISSHVEDFTGFTFNGHHSSEFHLIRISSSNRYNDNLLPTTKAKTASVNGQIGTYYFGSDITQREFSINFAFDQVTEEDLRKMRKWLSIKTLAPLIFDETPYKQYMVRPSDLATLKYVCFDDDNGQRLYKGDGSVKFIAYYPYATSRYNRDAGDPYLGKFLDDYKSDNEDEDEDGDGDEDYIYAPTLDQWKVAAALVNRKYDDDDNAYDTFSVATTTAITTAKVINVGDIDTFPVIEGFLTSASGTVDIQFNMQSLTWTVPNATSSRNFKVDMKMRTVAVDNKYMPASGNFFTIPAGGVSHDITISANSVAVSNCQIHYNYIFL